MNVLTRADVERLWHQEDEDWEKVPPEVRDAIHGVADEMLSRWPEGWEMRAREPSEAMVEEGAWALMGSGVPGAEETIAKDALNVWRAMWDAAKAEAGDE